MLYRLAIAIALTALAAPALAAQPPPPRGRVLAEQYCGACHAVARSDESPLPGAPPFRILYERYPVDSLQEALAEGILTGHPDMPQVAFNPSEIDSFIAYLKSLEGTPRR